MRTMSPPENGDVELEASGAATAGLDCALLGAAVPPVLPPLPDAPLVLLAPPPVLLVAPPPPATFPAAALPPPVPAAPPVPVIGVCVSGATPWYWACELDWARLVAGAPRANDPARRARQIRLLIGEL